MTLKELANVALRGTARAELPKLQNSVLEQALARLETTNAAAALLSRAALAGLHARAGVTLWPAESAPPTTLPPASSPLPEQLWRLLLGLVSTSASLMTLDNIKARGWTLSAAQGLRLLDKNVAAYDLWPLLDERGRAVLDTHPIHAAWQKAEAAAQWQTQLDTLRELRLGNPTAGAAQTLTLWKEVGADERRGLLDMLEAHMLPEDLPLLQHAEKDRSAELQKRVRMLQGHLPGPLQDELVALLSQAVKKQGKSWKMMPFDLPEALGKVKAGDYQDSEHHRLLGALPLELILQTLGIEAEALAVAAQKKQWHLGHFVRDLIKQHQQKRRTQAQQPPHIQTATQLGQWIATTGIEITDALYPLQDDPNTDWRALTLAALELMQQGRTTALSPAALEQALYTTLAHCANLLDPSADIPMPQPLPLVLPPAPTMPQTKRVQWEAEQVAAHTRQQEQAEAAWRELSAVLRLRREWVQALQATQ